MATYQSPGVYIEEIAAGPRPIQASGTTSTGFVGVLQLPGSFKRGFATYNGFSASPAYADALIPQTSVTQVFATWTVASAFFPLSWAAFKAPLKDGKAVPQAVSTVQGTVNIADATGDAWATLTARRKTAKATTTSTNTQDDIDRASLELDQALASWTSLKATLDASAKDLAALSASAAIPGLDATQQAAVTAAITASQAAVAGLKTALEAYETALAGASNDPTDAAATAKEADVLTARNAVTALLVQASAGPPAVTAGAVAAMNSALVGYKPPDPFASAASDLNAVTSMLLPTGYSVAAPTTSTEIVLSNNTTTLVMERDAAFVNGIMKDRKLVQWVPSLASLDDPAGIVSTLAPVAIQADIPYDASQLPGVPGNANGVTLLPEVLDALQDTLANPAPMVTTMDGFHTWRQELGRKLFVELLQKQSTKVAAREANDKWNKLPDDARQAWDSWIRNQSGMRLLELAVSGFFANGGTVAYMGVALAAEGSDVADRASLLKKWFDSVSDAAILVAPGLNREWQGAIMDYARMPAPSGRGDLFAILDTPRFFLSEPPSGIEVASNKDRWVTVFDNKDKSASAYEMPVLELLSTPVVPALRYNPNDTEMDAAVPRDAWGYGAAYGPWLIVRNPVATGTHDAFVVAPPSGYIAGCYAYNDNTYGVQKVPANQPVGAIVDVVASVTAAEQGPINVKGINLIRVRPGGILIWGGRTTSTDGLWRYINFRRVFLFIERSVRDAVQYAVFLPNNDQTRSDRSSTIGGFLYAQWQSQVLDGASMKDAYFVQCDAKNNPIETRRNGYLNVDVGIQPPYPAEFVVIRFRQMA
jgi:hypothetical protein